MSVSAETWDDAGGPRLRTFLLVSGVVHFLVVGALLPLLRERHDSRNPFLGYLGAPQFSSQLDILAPGSLHFSFYQPARAGAPSASAESWLERQTKLVAEANRLRHPVRKSVVGPPGGGGVSEIGPAGSGQGGSGVQTTDGIPDALPPMPALAPEVPFSDEFVIQRLVKPPYPEEGLTNRVRANLVVAIHVGLDGEVDDAVIQETVVDPPVAPARAFELASLEALRQWKVLLPERYRSSQGVWLKVPIEFRLEDHDPVHVENPSLP